MNLEENLFGGADSKYVTRNQLAKLANLVQSRMRVLEEYQIPEEKFSDEFIDTILKNSGDKLQCAMLLRCSFSNAIKIYFTEK